MNKHSGISLIEQLITLLVTSMAVLGVMKFQTTMFDAELNSKQRAEAVSLAQQQLEVLRSAGYDPTSVTGNDAVQGTTTRFIRSWVITPDPNLKYDHAKVEVAWSAKGGNNNVSLDSRIAKTSQTDSGAYMLGQLTANADPIASSSAPSGTTPANSPANNSSTPGTTGATPADSNSTPRPASCTPTTFAGGVCSYSVSAEPSGWSGNIATTSPGYSGTATAKCTDGQWSLSGVTCTPIAVTCTCLKSRLGQTYAYGVGNGQDAHCTVAICTTAPNQCTPANNAFCTYSVTVSQ